MLKNFIGNINQKINAMHPLAKKESYSMSNFNVAIGAVIVVLIIIYKLFA